MITFSPNPLNQADDSELRMWLVDSGAALMRKVIESRLNAKLVDAMKPALESSEFGQSLESANTSLRQAQKYQIFLTVFQELIDQPEEAFEINRLVQ